MVNKILKMASRLFCAALALILVFSCLPLSAFATDPIEDDPFIMISFGDSYSAGEGIPEFYGPVQNSGESDYDFWTRRFNSNDFLAHRSPDSWPAQLEVPGIDGVMRDYRVNDGATSSRDVQWHFVACSGAVTKDIHTRAQPRKYKRTVGPIWNRQTLQSNSKTVPVQMDIFNRVDGNQVDYITLTIGGNDLGFSEVVAKAVTGSEFLDKQEEKISTMLDKRWEGVQTHLDNVKATYEKLAEKAPNADIIVAGYPGLFDREGAGWLISELEADAVNEKVTMFNNALEGIVDGLADRGKNIHFVSVEEAFTGHEAYASNNWLNPVTVPPKSDDLVELDTSNIADTIASAYSIHPNARGAQEYARLINQKIAEIEANKKEGTLSGLIVKASDRSTPVTDALIEIDMGNHTRNLHPNVTGQYTTTLPVGNYHVKVSADGYIDFNAYAEILEDQTVYMETFLMVEGEEGDIGSCEGTITNALTGSGLEGVTLDVRSGWNNTTEGEVLTTVTTSASGHYTVTLPIGNYTLCATKNGFISSSINIVVPKNACFLKNGAMTPVISGDDYRIVLNWGADPRDLDSHLVGSTSSNSSFHVYYGSKYAYDGGMEVCNLDVDDTSGYGPETITLKANNSTPYYYYIYHYSGNKSISQSGARIDVYQGQNLIATFNAPTDQGTDRYWNVFAIVDGRLVVNNTITSSANLSYAAGRARSIPFADLDLEADMAMPKEEPAEEETLPGEGEEELLPDATEPEVTEPEVTEPEVTEPEVTEPEVTEPEVTEPVAALPPEDPEEPEPSEEASTEPPADET